ncbi:MAG: lytic transglycosylase domain-containing protein [bacterium]|nr:lytic transglycosylase domain-containing protein [bacterium]
MEHVRCGGDAAMALAGRVLLLCLPLLWLGWPCAANAELYKYVKNGVVHYSNRPPEKVMYSILNASAQSFPLPSVREVIPTKHSKESSGSKQVPHDYLIRKIANRYQISPALIRAIIKVESNFNHRAVSPKGAQGLMQLIPATAKRFGVDDSFDPEENITGGVKYLQFLFEEFGQHNLHLVLAGYNAGEQAVKKYGNKIPPYKETQAYVKKVKALYFGKSPYKSVRAKSIYRYTDKNGVVAFTNVPRVN